MRLHGDLPCQIAAAQHLEPVLELFDNAASEERLRREAVSFEMLERADIDDGVLFPENIGEATLRQAAVQRHLATLEAAQFAIAGDGLGTLGAAAGVLTPSASHTLADSLPLLLLPLWRAQITEIHFAVP